MVFSDSYDRSLWLMVKSNNKNRSKLVEFIKSIPEELYLEIKDKIFICDKYRKNNVWFYAIEKKEFHGNYEMDDKLYYYRIDPYSYSLTLGYSIKKTNDYKSEFELLLMPNDDLDVILDDGIFIGYVEPNVYIDSGFKSKKLRLTSGILSKSEYRFMVSSSLMDEIVSIGMVNIKNIPNDINLVDLENKRDVNRLIKNRRR